VNLTGSYAAMFRVLSAIVAVTAGAALVVAVPQSRMLPLSAAHGAA
jgi:hypothetical protein